jgi:hypothetical protein
MVIVSPIHSETIISRPATVIEVGHIEIPIAMAAVNANSHPRLNWNQRQRVLGAGGMDASLAN